MPRAERNPPTCIDSLFQRSSPPKREVVVHRTSPSGVRLAVPLSHEISTKNNARLQRNGGSSPYNLELALGSWAWCIDRDVPVKWTTGKAFPFIGPGASIRSTRSFIVIKRIASCIVMGGRGLPSSSSWPPKLKE